MPRSSVSIVAAAMVWLGVVSCGGKSPVTEAKTQPSTPVTSNPGTSKPADPQSDAFPKGQVSTYMLKITPGAGPSIRTKVTLSAAERASLEIAFAKADAVQPAHLHATTAANGDVVFSADNSSDKNGAAHVTGNEPEIALSANGASRKVVLDPSALRVLQSRLAH